MIWDVLAGMFLLVILYLLVKPGSDGTVFIKTISDALTVIVQNAADLAGDGGTAAATTEGN